MNLRKNEDNQAIIFDCDDQSTEHNALLTKIKNKYMLKSEEEDFLDDSILL